MVIDQRRQARGSALPKPHIARESPLRTPGCGGASVHRPPLDRSAGYAGHTSSAQCRGCQAPDLKRSCTRSDRLQQLTQPLEREELALQRHQQRIGRRQRVEQSSSPSEGGQSIRQISCPVSCGQSRAQLAGAICHADQLDFRARKIDRCRNHIKARNSRRHAYTTSTLACSISRS